MSLAEGGGNRGNNRNRSILTLLAQRGHSDGILSAFPEMGHNYEFMSSPSVKNKKGGGGRTRLMHAAFIGDMDRLRELIKGVNANIDIQDNNQMTALSWAAFAGKLRAVQFLVENGAEINTGVLYKTPLYLAVKQNHLTTVQWLCDRGATIFIDSIGEACKDSVSPQILQVLCEHGANVTQPGVNGTPLHSLATSRITGAEKVGILVRHNAPLEAIYIGATPLIFATVNSNVAVVRALCEFGADKEAVSQVPWEPVGLTPLMWACYEKISDGTVTALCELGANKEARDPQGRTAIFYALEKYGVKSPREDNFLELLGQDVNIQARFGNVSVLDATIATGMPSLLRALCSYAVRKNIDINIPMVTHTIKKKMKNLKSMFDALNSENKRLNLQTGHHLPVAGIQNEKLSQTIYKLGIMLNVLEDYEVYLKTKPSMKNTRKTSAAGGANSSNNWRGSPSGGAKSSNNAWWRGGSKRKRKTKKSNRK
jgi:ankyrin repeat protein